MSVVLSALLAASAIFQPIDDPELEARAKAIHDRVIALDTHVDIPNNYASHEMDPGGFTSNQVDLPKMRVGGLDAAFFIVYTGQGERTPEGYAAAYANADDKANDIHRMVNGYPDQIALARTADDVRRIAAEGKKVALIGMENPYPLGESVDDLQMWFDRGVRYVSITHSGHNQFGDSAIVRFNLGDTPGQYGGLTDLGRELIAEANRLGVMVDISHASDETMMQAMALSQAPVIASHSSVDAVADHPRNLSDEHLRALAENGGVAQMVALGSYVKTDLPEKLEARDAILVEMGMDTAEGRETATPEQWAEARTRIGALDETWPGATVSDFVDHIDHAVAVAGIDHVGIASDFDGGGGITGWEDATSTLNVTREMVRRGYSEEEIAKIWGENLLRVMEEVEAHAASYE